jgi:hypothetical protein
VPFSGSTATTVPEMLSTGQPVVACDGGAARAGPKLSMAMVTIRIKGIILLRFIR